MNSRKIIAFKEGLSSNLSKNCKARLQSYNKIVTPIELIINKPLVRSTPKKAKRVML